MQKGRYIAVKRQEKSKIGRKGFALAISFLGVADLKYETAR